jgi:hypothetical protein
MESSFELRTFGSDTKLNYHLSQKFKLIGRGKFNHLINTLIVPLTCELKPLLIDEVQYVEYLIEIGGK